MLAALAILAGGCASRRAVDRLESDVGRLRSELAEMRVGQEATSRDLANVSSQLQALDVKALGDEVARLNRRADAVDSALAATQTKVDALVPAPGASSVPAPPPVPQRAERRESRAAAPERRREDAGPGAVAARSSCHDSGPGARAVRSSVDLATAGARAAAGGDDVAVADAIPDGGATAVGGTAHRGRREAARDPPPAPAAPPATTVTPGKSAQKGGGNPEQEYAAALATFRAREHGQAVLDFLDFIAKYPKHPLAANAQYWIGEAYYAQRDYRQALVEFEKVFEHGPRRRRPTRC